MPVERGSADTRGGQIQSVDTAFEILDAIEALAEPTLSVIADEVDLAKSTVFDHLQTLEAKDFVVRTADDSYRIGLRFLDYGGQARNQHEIYRIAKPELEKLAETTGELVNLAVEEHGIGVYVDYVRGEESVNLDTYVGKREYLHSTAFGKAILAFLPDHRVDEIIDRRGLPSETEGTVATRSELDSRLERIRKRGFAVDREERLEGLRCVAAPVVNSDDGVLGAVSISGPTSRLHDDRLTNELADEVMRTANIIEINLTYS